MGIGQFAEWLDVVYKIMVGAFGIWLYLDRKNDKTHLRISQLEERIDQRLDAHAGRIVRMEAVVEKQPTHDNLADVYREIRKVSDSVAGLTAAISAVQATLVSVEKLTSRMDTFWRDHKS
ncbi:hypothetical protein [Methylomonas sp. ZR1]|uniref:hypothetical protein n=1 Tax=Methylomonas sp. ZR1 TaxID=1797072 RepID=UPI001492336D|nr:hypothetical protein [Methylomonas sp. ZR1]NOV29179.1 hypothetical protein [Methylomonas sp. ZR1]